ncbi:phage tail protein [Nitrosomonas sp.]|uniref:phage tail protein n=1 Tax=Nitrosomonas sp. TaxID=42353 RepID=UPI001DEE3596|nr:phage tail protein [Nitrosomonas sp.]MBX3616337.1 phage tail protein [Nitrosomonas sp.]
MSGSMNLSLSDSIYPPSAFYFKVIIGPPAGLTTDTSFQEVSGIDIEMDVETVTEGGENRFVRQLPKGTKHSNLSLKRGIASMDSPLVIWCKATLESGLNLAIKPLPVLVYLMNEDKVPIRGWAFDSAYPLKWEVESFGSTKNEVAIEKIILSYTSSSRII